MHYAFVIYAEKIYYFWITELHLIFSAIISFYVLLNPGVTPVVFYVICYNPSMVYTDCFNDLIVTTFYSGYKPHAVT